MLARQYRFRGLGSVRPVMQRGVTARDGLFTIKAMARHCRSGAPCYSRAAVVVSKKVSKSAVKRNRLRRQIYEVLRRHWSHLPQSPVEVVVIVHDIRLNELSTPELEKRLLRSLDTAFSRI